MSNIQQFNARALTFQRRHPDLKWQHCCILAAYYTQHELDTENELRRHDRQTNEDSGFFKTFLDEAAMGVGKVSLQSTMHHTITQAEKLDGGRDDGLGPATNQ